MSEWFVGREVHFDGSPGREVRRWRVSFTRKRLRLLDRDGVWAVLWQVEGVEMRAYPAQEQAEDVCARLMAADGDTWREVELPAPWWS